MLKRTVSLVVIAAILLCSMSVGILYAFSETVPAELDAQFEAHLDAEGFPESYRPMLRELHKKYPNWIFRSLKTGLNWKTVLSAEYILSDSLIDKSATSSWKSFDSGRYNFSTSTFVGFDDNAYHAASYEYLSYCMDPRNFLTETSALMFFVAYGQTGETIEGINKILSGLNWAKNYPDNNEVVYIYEDGTYDIIVNSTPPTPPEQEEEEEQPDAIGTIQGISVRIRQTASTGSAILLQLDTGAQVTVLGEENGTEYGGSTKWYKIKYGDIIGYVHSSLITVSAAPAAVEEVSSESTSSEVAASENTSSDNTQSGGTSSDNISSDNLSSDTTSSDSTSSEETSSDTTSSDGTSSDGTSSEFVPTKPVKEKIEIDSYGKAFYAAHKITGISAYMLASRIRQEQGLNGNASGQGIYPGYEGYYNPWNIEASGKGKLEKGAKYAKEHGWDTPLKGIIGGSVWLDSNYFKTGQDTFYLQKYDIVDGGNGYYWHEYMTYLPAPWQEAKILKMAFTEEALQDEAVFKIPIYNNMPEEPCPCPKSTGSNNNYLKSISVEGTPISNFYVYTLNYTDIVVDYSEKITVEAEAYDSGATVSGVGELELAEGINKVEIKVTASNGIEKIYTVNIFMNEAPEPEPPTPEDPDDPDNPDDPEPIPTPSIGSTVYILDQYITGIEPETTVEAFIQNLAVTDGTVKIFGDGDTEKAADAFVATGDKVVIYKTDETEYLTINLIIYGDVNADGKITSVDILLARRKILSMSELNEYQAVAANINKDTNLTSVDLLYIRRYILGYIQSLQGE